MNLVIHSSMWYTFRHSHSILVIAFVFWWISSFLAFYLVVHQPCNAETDTCAYRYLSNTICTVVEEWTHGYFCLAYFSSSTHFDLVTRVAQKVCRKCVLGFCARFWASWRKLQRSPCEHWPSLSTDNRYLFLLQRLTIRFDSLSLLLIQLSHAWRQSFVIEVSDLYSSSPWFSTFDRWEPRSSDESPCRTIPIRFWVARTHVFSICTDFPRYHRMESLTWSNREQISIIQYCIMSDSHSKVVVDHEGDLPSS